ncbi:hypothetical protein B0H13DRAFT_2341831 [Mycena leptocephala]|nr:hypothetical protein B0H13DRAFT_2341831 [Mycena leptocephala]
MNLNDFPAGGTAQKQLAVTKEKHRARKEIEIEKIRAVTKVKIDRRKVKSQEKLAKVELAHLKMQHEHELKMLQFGTGPSQYTRQGQSSHAGSSSMGSTGMFAGNDDNLFSSSSSTPYGFSSNMDLSEPFQ